MKKSFHFALCALWIVVLSSGCNKPPASGSLLHLLPSEADLPGWMPQGTAQTAVGDDLYLLINGGAETYLEFGFRQAVIQSYETADGHMFNLEIYEMTDPEAAQGIYTFKAGSSGRPLDIGDASRLESYYLNLRQERHIITVIGLDASETTMKALTKAARIVASRITEDQHSEPPGP